MHILDTLEEDSVGLVSNLADQLEVSESTIRRDLEELETQGLIQRIHGGAVLVKPELKQASPFDLRQTSHNYEKDLVGRAAAEWVRDGEVIFLDGGTTTQSMVPYLLDRLNLTVVTCGLNIACALSDRASISTIVIGGELHVPSQSFIGPTAVEALGAIRCDRAFIGTGGISAEHGVTNRFLGFVEIKRKAMEISRQAAVVTDGSKIGIATLGHVAPVEAFDLLVTDTSAPKDELERIAARSVEITLTSMELVGPSPQTH
jgi:DeoR/GlpR family transcriptional regulator of sugar metabolism